MKEKEKKNSLWKVFMKWKSKCKSDNIHFANESNRVFISYNITGVSLKTHHITVLYYNFLDNYLLSVCWILTIVSSHHTADARGQFEHVGHSGGIQQLVLQLRKVPVSHATYKIVYI